MSLSVSNPGEQNRHTPSREIWSSSMPTILTSREKFGIIRESVESAVKDEEQRQHDLNKSLERLWKEFDEMGEKVSVDSNHVTGIVNKIKRKMKEIRHLKI